LHLPFWRQISAEFANCALNVFATAIYDLANRTRGTLPTNGTQHALFVDGGSAGMPVPQERHS